MKKTILLFIILLSISKISDAQTDTVRKPVAFFFSSGLVSGKDYGNDVRSALVYNGYAVSGFFGWISLDLGVNVSLSDNFILSPHINTLYDPINYSSTIDGTTLQGSESANFLFLPGVSAKYYFFNKKNSSLFISAGVSASLSSSDVSNFDYKSDGIEKEVFIGYEYTLGFHHRKNKTVRDGSFGLKLGYMSIPVSNFNNNTNAFENNDFGGYAFSIYLSY